MSIKPREFNLKSLVVETKKIIRNVTIAAFTIILLACFGDNPKAAEVKAPKLQPTVNPTIAVLIKALPISTLTSEPQPTATVQVENAITGTTQTLIITDTLKSAEKTVEQMITSKMVFLRIPQTEEEATSSAQRFTDKYNELAKDGKTGLFLFEPDPSTNWQEFSNGKYDKSINVMFGMIAASYSGKLKGKVILFPELNSPIWNNADMNPSQITYVFNRIANILYKQNTGLEIGILLNSKSYPTHDWGNGEFSPLTPYIAELDPKLNVELGVQGFHWIDKDTGEALTDPNVFLNVKQILEAAKQMHTQKIIINTGIQGRRKLDDGTIVEVSQDQRLSIFVGILMNIHKIQMAGYEVELNMFMENKLDGPNDNSEGTDWSFNNKDLTVPVGMKTVTGYISLYDKILRELSGNGIEISVFQ